ncbi:hypothetical protein [Nonomuraea sp. NPDC050783]|uniref:hypothetical protein n=1 Tax=Nonomuraea sp. NPDC050783 TaxID=3154634 RepID=UPI0034677728
MSHGDDLDERFNALAGQIDADEQRRMRAAATKAATPGRVAPTGLPADPYVLDEEGPDGGCAASRDT